MSTKNLTLQQKEKLSRISIVNEKQDLAYLIRQLNGDGKFEGNYGIEENFNIISIIPQSKTKKKQYMVICLK